MGTKDKLKASGSRRPARFVDSAHQEEFARAVKAGVLGSWDGVVAPPTYLTKLVDQAADFMLTTRPQGNRPRQPWISESTWNYMLLLNKYRRLQSALHRGDRRYASMIADSILNHGGGRYFPIGHDNALDAVEEAIRVLRQTTRRMLNADRRKWFHDACAAIPSNAETHRASPIELHKAVKRLCSDKRSRPGSRLRRADGSIAVSPDEVNNLWMLHWKSHFNGEEVEIVDFENRATLLFDDPLGAAAHDAHDSDAYVYSADQILRTIRQLPQHKVTPDAIPAEVWHIIAPQAVEPLAKFFTELQESVAVPRSFAGARIVGVWKKKGDQMTATQYRPISLMKFEAKLWSKLLLGQLTARLRHHRGQYGSGGTVGVAYPQLVIRQLTAHCRANRTPSATLYVDVSAAFDSVLKPYLWGLHPHDQDLCQPEDSSYSPAQAEAIGAFLASHPSILAQCGLPSSLIAVLRCWGKGSWFTVDSSSACSSSVGVRQGDNISALIFDIFYGFIMSKLYLELVSCGILTHIPMVRSRSFVVSGSLVAVGPSAFRDDMAIPLSADTNEELLLRVKKLAEIVDSVHKQFHLQVNWSRSKTEVTINLIAPTGKPLMQGMKNIGHVNMIGGPAIALQPGRFLVIAAAYVHLGCVTTQDGSCAKEINRMVSRTSVELHLKRRLLTSSSLDHKDRLMLFSIYILCHLLLNVAILPKFTAAQYDKLNAVFMRGVKMCVDRVSSGAEVFHDRHCSILSKFSFRDYQTFIDKRKLTFFLRLATVECDVIRSAAHLDFGKFSIWPPMFEALSRLRACVPALQELPEPCELSLGDWALFVVAHHLEWKKWVHDFRGPPIHTSGPPLWTEDDTVQPEPEPEAYDSEWEDTAPLSAVLSLGLSRPPALDQPAEYPCSMCSFKGKSQAGLVMHQRRKHGLQSDLSLRTTSPVCPCCHSN
eukprot:4225777-Amphidinium_carterae.2